MDSDKQRLIEEELASYMIAEFGVLQSARDSLNTVTNTRVNVFLASVSATVLTLSFVVNAYDFDTNEFFLIATGLLLSVLFLGRTILIGTLEAQGSMINYIRGMNRIRRYFVERAIRDRRDIARFFILPTVDNLPSFDSVDAFKTNSLGRVGTIEMIGTINSAVVGALSLAIAILAGRLANSSLPDPLCVLITLGSAGLAWWMHKRYIRTRLQEIEADPSTKPQFVEPIVEPIVVDIDGKVDIDIQRVSSLPGDL